MGQLIYKEILQEPLVLNKLIGVERINGEQDYENEST